MTTLVTTASLAGWLVVQQMPAAAAGLPGVIGTGAAHQVSVAAPQAKTKERCRAEGFSPVRRGSVIKRGRAWVKAKVPYDQRACHRTAAKNRPGDRYRMDCSGFVSMAWALGHSYTTASFARDRPDRWHTIEWADLEPGDAIVVHTHDLQHMVLFVTWNDSDRTELKSYESRGESLGTVANVRRVEDMKSAGYHPIRHDHIQG